MKQIGDLIGFRRIGQVLAANGCIEAAMRFKQEALEEGQGEDVQKAYDALIEHHQALDALLEAEAKKRGNRKNNGR
jgi:hypothetical protein